MTPLMMCAQDGEEDMVRSLLEYGAQVNLQSPTGETALMYAAITGEYELVKILLRSGADPSAANDLGFTAAMMAANRGHLEVIQRLVVYDQDVPNTGFLDARDPSGHNALDHAVRSNEPEVVQVLMAAGAAVGRVLPNVSRQVLLQREAALERKRRQREQADGRVPEEPVKEVASIAHIAH